MSKKLNSKTLIPIERIASHIMLMRDEKIMLDFHLAELYGVETRALKQAVKRNFDRFPADFMFELNEDEINSLVSQNVIPSKGQLGGAVPYAFTDGVNETIGTNKNTGIGTAKSFKNWVQT